MQYTLIVRGTGDDLDDWFPLPGLRESTLRYATKDEAIQAFEAAIRHWQTMTNRAWKTVLLYGESLSPINHHLFRD